MRKNPHMAMTDHDLAELYGYIKLFMKTYDDAEAEAETLCLVIERIFTEQTSIVYGAKADIVLGMLRNPRGAGRKRRLTPEQEKDVVILSEEGLSIREISEETTIPRSTVQRILSRHKT